MIIGNNFNKFKTPTIIIRGITSTLESGLQSNNNFLIYHMLNLIIIAVYLCIIFLRSFLLNVFVVFKYLSNFNGY